jgi:peptide/nickel transport system substrate-binding protein
VTFHLVAPDPDFLDQLALEFAYAMPPGAPQRETSTPLPATGPYMIASYRPGHVLTLVRNPYFHEWSKAAQPDGYPDSIVFTIGGTPDGAVRDVLAGKADAFSTSQSENPPSAAILDMLTLRHASQVHTNPQQATIALFLNTRLAPFDRLDVRRALNFAADRAAAAQISGGPAVARPTCQILPPHFPGYRPYCPYTAHASTAGVWNAADLDKARALVARSGTRGMKITVWSWSDLAGLGPYTTRLLHSLGYRVSLKTVRGNDYFATAFNSRNDPQIGTAEWITDYPTASGFFDPLFTCASFQPRSSNNVNGAEFCDPRLDRKISRAVTEQTTNPDAARRLWAQIDRSTVDAAPWVPLVNPNVVDVLSNRVGNYQYNPAGWGMLIDQLWVRPGANKTN